MIAYAIAEDSVASKVVVAPSHSRDERLAVDRALLDLEHFHAMLVTYPENEVDLLHRELPLPYSMFLCICEKALPCMVRRLMTHSSTNTSLRPVAIALSNSCLDSWNCWLC